MSEAVRFRDEEPNALASMLADLIRARESLRTASGHLRGGTACSVGVRAADIGLSATVEFGAGAVAIRNGWKGEQQMRIRSDAATLLELSEVPTRLGYPDPFSRDGRKVYAAIRARRLTVSGAVRHPIVMRRFLRLVGG